jgi:hypothetical protein
MIPHPNNIQLSAYASFPFEPLIISLLNKNSCASSCDDINFSVISRVYNVTHLYKPRVNQDTGAERVQHAADY